jgi:uncharacterized protein (DUF924 family)
VTPGELLEFWFAEGPDTQQRAWFVKDAAFDDTLRERFGAWLAAARQGALDGWATTPGGTLALIILLDQLSRNIHRGTAESFAADKQALDLAIQLVDSGEDQRLTPTQRIIAYLPFEHSEAMADQDRSVALFESLRQAPGMETVIDFAHRHRTVIARFGRFPHRNAVLGRTNTPEEVAYLAQPGAGF